MNEHEASRTLVKSPPELWAECSDAQSLARHLSGPFFGEIRITRLEPETTVAWEGENASGSVRLEPSGWGTRVTLTVASSEPATADPEPAEPEPEPADPRPAEPEPTEPYPPIAAEATRRRRLFARFSAFFMPAPEDSAVPQHPPAHDASASALPHADASAGGPPEDDDPAAEEALTAALNSLGQAHHRPFSRA
jgi:hypothetical protein